MTPKNFQSSVENKFDYMCKQVMRNEKKNYYKQLLRVANREVSLSTLEDYMSDELQTMDRYPSNFLHLSLLGFSIDIENEALGAAIEESLSDKKRTILLLYYFLDMNENEIADLFHVSASTINRQRHQALKAIRNYMEEHENED